VGGIGYDLAIFERGEGPLCTGNDLGWGLVCIPHEERGVRVMEIGGGIWAVQTIGEQLDLTRGVGLKLHQDLPRDGAVSALRLRDPDAHEPVDCRDIMLPATPHHGVAVAHQEPIPRVQRRTGDRGTWGMIEQPERHAVSPVRHVEQGAVIATLGVNRCEDAHIRGETHQAVVVTRGKVEIRDPPVEEMGRIHRKMRCSIELFIGTNGTKSAPIG